jgi:hypothetical protein
MSELTVGQLKGLPINSNIITVPSGQTLYAPGHVIQVVNVEYAGRASQGFSGSTITDVIGLEAKITPRSVSSKIVIQVRWFGEFNSQDRVYNTVWGISRNGIQINRQADPSGTVASGLHMASISYWAQDPASTPETINYFTSDSPATTSEVTYRGTIISDGAGTLFTGRTVVWSGQSVGYELGTCSMMLMEIAQ